MAATPVTTSPAPATPVNHNITGDDRSPRWLVGFSVIVGLLFALPGVFVFIRAAQIGDGFIQNLNEILAPLGRTVLLATTVAVAASALGTALAWLVTRSDLPGRSFWRIWLVLPLVLPSFVGAAAFLASLAPGGLLHELLDVVGVESPRLRGFWPSFVLLTLFTYPYVLLPVSSRLRSLNPALEESARLLGRSSTETFRTVTLPQLRSSILASGLLVFLYIVSEFGAVQLLGYDTLTRVIFATRLVDRGTSFTAAAALIVLALVVVAGERRARRSDRVDDRARLRPTTPIPLGRSTPLAVGFVAMISLLGLVAPVASLATWAIRGITDGRIDYGDLVGPIANTALTGVVTAVVAVLVILPVAVLIVRHRSVAGRTASVAVVGGFAVPGLVVALSLVFWALNTPVLNRLYQTLPLLIGAYVIHFGSQALGACEQAVRSVPQSLRESSQLLERSTPERLWRIDYPMMRPSLVSGAGLVLLSTAKELPATLLLAPIGFDSLATDIWQSFEDGFYAEVGVGSIVLIALSGTLTWWLVLRPAREHPANRSRTAHIE